MRRNTSRGQLDVVVKFVRAAVNVLGPEEMAVHPCASGDEQPRDGSNVTLRLVIGEV
jgi:hypothetical protein